MCRIGTSTPFRRSEVAEGCGVGPECRPEGSGLSLRGRCTERVERLCCVVGLQERVEVWSLKTGGFGAQVFPPKPLSVGKTSSSEGKDGLNITGFVSRVQGFGFALDLPARVTEVWTPVYNLFIYFQ